MKQEPLHNCTGCTDKNSEGTHQMHTIQHPCPENGDPHCGYCFPEKTPRIEEMVEEFKEVLAKERVQYTEEQLAWFENTLTQANQAGRDEAVKIVENINISTKIGFIKPEDQKGYRQAQTDIIKALQDNK